MKPLSWVKFVMILYTTVTIHEFVMILYTTVTIHEFGRAFDRRQCDQLWHNFAKVGSIINVFGNCFRLNLIFGKIVELGLEFFNSIGLIFIVTNGQILGTNLTIWSHC